MSENAIEEMVAATFDLANACKLALTLFILFTFYLFTLDLFYWMDLGLAHLDAMDFQMFKNVVEKDSNLLAWFESLGSVF